MEKKLLAINNIGNSFVSGHVQNVTGKGISLKSLHPANLAHFIAETAIPENKNGFTLDPETLIKPDFDERCYLVSLRGHEQKFDVIPRKSKIQSWITPRVFILSRLNHYIGWWFNTDNKKYYLDITFPIIGEEQAILSGQKNMQDYIYHPASGEKISVLDKLS